MPQVLQRILNRGRNNPPDKKGASSNSRLLGFSKANPNIMSGGAVRGSNHRLQDIPQSQMPQELQPYLKKVTSHLKTCTLEQRVVLPARQGQPWVSLELGLTTALRGRRVLEGLTQGAYLLRLEILNSTPGLRLSGFSLGPWHKAGLDLEVGNMVVADPLWFGFAPVQKRVRGRLRLYDSKNKNIMEAPWSVEALVPGDQTF
jgi:hypothetical protein